MVTLDGWSTIAKETVIHTIYNLLGNSFRHILHTNESFDCFIKSHSVFRLQSVERRPTAIKLCMIITCRFYMERQYIFIKHIIQIKTAESCQLDFCHSGAQKLKSEALYLGSTAFSGFNRHYFTIQQCYITSQADRCVTITRTAHNDTLGCVNFTYFHHLVF